MNKPKLLDLFCGAGGCAEGFKLAGFYVVGVDVIAQPNYAGDEFYQDDALHFLDTHDLSSYGVLHGSPTCKGFSLASGFHPQARQRHVNLIPPLRERFRQSGKPYLIENVAGAPLIKAIMLCGTMFGLRVYRHRYFESNILLFEPHHPRHTVKAAAPGAIAKEGEFWCVGGHFGRKDEAQGAMGIHWMQTQEEIAQAIPPTYTEYLGRQFRTYLESEHVA